MTQEEKQLLLVDLCGRLPYGVIVQDRNGVHALTQGNTEFTDLFNGKCNIKPYLRPMSSMTDEEREDFYRNRIPFDGDMWGSEGNDVDWLNAHHFDYRGLIEKGLALEAPEGMYSVNEK